MLHSPTKYMFSKDNCGKTKIICTIGPSSWDPEILTNLILSGMSIARLNFSHGTKTEKKTQIDLLRKLSKKLKKRVSIIADLQGPKLRLGLFDGIVTIKKGDLIKLSVDAGPEIIPILADFSPFLKKGQRVFLNDGLIELMVLGVKQKIIRLRAKNDGWITSNKGINLPDTHLNYAAFTVKDQEDAKFAISEKVDFLALSFVQTADDIKIIKDLIIGSKANTKIIAKIEKKEAITNLPEITEAADALMVARGDLGVETRAEEIPLLQQKIVRLAREHQKPVIVATHMLESMVVNPRPTQAEVSDVANAVINQVDAVMLSAETALGKYPVEVVKVMREIILSAESTSENHRKIDFEWKNLQLENLHTNAIAYSAALLAAEINSQIIIVATSSGKTARQLSSFRPHARILAATEDEGTCKQLNLVWGVTPMAVKPIKHSDAYWKKIITAAETIIPIKKGEKIILVGGSKIGISGATDSIKIITI